ncbi:MAG: hypothetical protein K0S06_2868 [Microvirga sp.]|nr:hypothetical protein [Microvirga sp.]
MASSPSPSQLIGRLMAPRLYRAQLSTLKVGSNIHFQAKVESTVGMMKGRRMNARVSALPLKCRFSSMASQSPSPSLNTVVTAVYQTVFQTTWWKIGSLASREKFATPTNSPGRPTRALHTDSMTPRMKG